MSKRELTPKQINVNRPIVKSIIILWLSLSIPILFGVIWLLSQNKKVVQTDPTPAQDTLYTFEPPVMYIYPDSTTGSLSYHPITKERGQQITQ